MFNFIIQARSNLLLSRYFSSTYLVFTSYAWIREAIRFWLWSRACSFTPAPYGVHNEYLGLGSPGAEDCLKLFVLKPTKARSGDKLPVFIFIHVS